jgi:hypothetical protein
LFHFLVKHKWNVFRQPQKQILFLNVITSPFHHYILHYISCYEYTNIFGLKYNYTLCSN